MELNIKGDGHGLDMDSMSTHNIEIKSMEEDEGARVGIHYSDTTFEEIEAYSLATNVTKTVVVSITDTWDVQNGKRRVRIFFKDKAQAAELIKKIQEQMEEL